MNQQDMGFVMEAMQLPLEAFGYQVVARQRIFGVFAKGAVRNQPQTLDEAYTVGEKLACAVK